MLTEDAAIALLAHYCEPLQTCEWADATPGYFRARHRAAHGHVDFIAKAAAASSTRHARRLGARLRLALGVAQAVSCCRGFDPATNMRFWRHVVTTLWRDESNRTNRLVLSRKSFHHVGVQWKLDSPADDTFWIGLFYGTPACDAMLAAVQLKLRPHLETAPLPALRVTLTRCGAYNTIYSSHALPLYQQDEPDLPSGVRVNPVVVPQATWSILRAAQTAPVATMWSDVPCHVGLCVHFRVGFGASIMQHTLALLQRRIPHAHLAFTIDQLTIELVPLKPPRVAEPSARSCRALASRGRPLGELLRGLLVARDDATPHVRTVELTGCSLTDYRHVGAALSVVALASPPVTELRCRGLFVGAACRDHVLRLAWLAFALHRRARATNTSLALVLQCTGVGVTVDETEQAYTTQLLALGTPLRDVVGEALRLRFGGDDDEVARLHVECLRLGSTVQFARGTQLCFQPFGDPKRHEDEAMTLDTDETLDLVARVIDDVGNGFVGVVLAGFGLVWAPFATVVASQHENAGAPSGRLALSSVRIEFDCVPNTPPMFRASALRVTGLLPLLASESLTSLTLDMAILSHNDLALVLDCFPQLEALALEQCLLESVEPLIDAWRRRAAVLSKLSLVGARDLRCRDKWPISTRAIGVFVKEDVAQWTASLVTALASGLGRPTLRELSLDTLGMSCEAERVLLALLVQGLTSGALPLSRLHVRWSGGPRETMLSVFGSLRDAVIRDPPRVRCAVLTVLRAFRCGSREVAREVLAMAERGTARTITWE